MRDLLYATSKLMDGQKPLEFLMPAVQPILGLAKELLMNNVVAELLKKYNVSYIYVGAAERATYPAEGLAKLDQLGDVAFQQGDVTIYRVKP